MVYIASWADFQDAAEVLCAKSPVQTRYCVKWRACEGKLVLKITDNITCLKFKTSHSLFLNRFEALNLALMQKMANRRPPAAPATVPLAVPAAAIPARQGTPMDVDAPAPAPGAAGAAGGGVKKKKPKKKK